ncbi:tRNA dimethylallyltransferase [Thermodesulfovibrio aggregans]|uniref:tRNA dimethylallyltransferase n=1 Tax=Thermodesulfovibrio aggregans TaxID=86166 RepID=A0A0U9I8L7_9BACT|nr:tRNA (adenosine(37)-N6)-dimethylallyltransferase MiaA [Thermodesulfovibrio aggregans]GAQ94086.1 tRNA dimethylallyltransferase [Thermodesulfovibrio aggregans]
MERKIIILLGPTGVGKTEVSIELAKLLNAEIISSDSMQIYRYMDIGTAKPNLEQRQEIMHHMIDIINPWEYFSTGTYIEKVKEIIEDIFQRNKIPLIVGGTGLYLRAMTEGIFEGPDTDWNLRKKLLEEEKAQPGKLYELLKEIDPDYAKKINPADLRRTVRALEVFFKERKNITEFQIKFTKPLPYDFIKIGLTRDRKILYRMIEERVDEMIKKGLVEEVRIVLNLIKKKATGDFPLPALQAIGYKEIAGYLADLYNLEEAIRLTKKRTKMYAKRQFTWFKKEKNINWFDITELHDPQIIAEKIFHFLKKMLNLVTIM